ncbi:MAG: DegT/DnrJ/EryC1/StrS family aminotransferase [Gemmatimonadaceae bacterium]
MSKEVRAIEELFRRRYGRHALYLPSGRLALYLAFREWLRPGDRVLMSPVNDDVVFFTVLAAGLVPVLGPIDPSTGNLDPAAIDDSDWTKVRAVLTTNLYGVPDRMDLLEERCLRHDLVLLEDAAHAIDSRLRERRIGEFGTAAAYSFSKHLGVFGGALTFVDAGRRDSLARRAAEVTRRRPLPVAIAHRARSLLSTVGASTRLRRWLARRRDRFVSRPRERSGYRIVYDAGAVQQAQRDGGGLDRFERWVRVDNYMYRTWPLRSAVRDTLRCLESFEESRRARLAGARKLLELGLTPLGLAVSPDTALLRVPLLIRDRDKARAHLAAHGLKTYYIYDPPLDLYAPGFVEPLASPSVAAAWSRDVLPVDPLVADRFLALLEESPGLCEPSMGAANYGG